MPKTLREDSSRFSNNRCFIDVVPNEVCWKWVKLAGNECYWKDLSFEFGILKLQSGREDLTKKNAMPVKLFESSVAQNSYCFTDNQLHCLSFPTKY